MEKLNATDTCVLNLVKEHRKTEHKITELELTIAELKKAILLRRPVHTKKQVVTTNLNTGYLSDACDFCQVRHTVVCKDCIQLEIDHNHVIYSEWKEKPTNEGS